MRVIQHLLPRCASAVAVLIVAVHSWGDEVERPSKAIATAEQITAETCRPNHDAIGHVLPLAGHWNVGVAPKGDTFDPQYQLRLIDEGHHIIPFLDMPTPATAPGKMQYWEQGIKRAAALHLPIALIASQWEAALSSDKAYLDLPPEANPNVVGVDGKILHEVDPFGPVEPWREIGRQWGASAGLAQLQRWYPDPPRIMLISNNEAAKLAWSDCEKDKRYVELYGAGKDGDFMRKVVSAGWIERYRAMIGSMREGLASPAWKNNAVFIGYDAFGPPHFGRMGGWREYSLYIPGRIDFSPLVWDGGSPSFYTRNWNASTDYTVWSPQVEAMNWVFMQQEALRLNPARLSRHDHHRAAAGRVLSCRRRRGGCDPAGEKRTGSVSVLRSGKVRRDLHEEHQRTRTICELLFGLCVLVG
ncbi:MAG TPA: hypothetical protein VG326_17760 [Tepidisphaeraceae bacterium]|jgi:hypothetical protein|nr:hypothetical protein [Tepidisphaeraceae bacterium]